MVKDKYIPALRFNWLTPFYDFFIGISMPEKKIKQQLVKNAAITDGMHVLDFGCGTATLTIMAKESHPGAILAGIDIDADILKRASQKMKARGLDILLLEYDGVNLPLSGSFARVISCLVFHHLDTATKQKALADIFKLLHRNGQLHIADFGRSKSWFQRMLFNTVRGLDGFKSTHANAKGLLPGLIADAGFRNITVNNRFQTMFGEVQLFSATKCSL